MIHIEQVAELVERSYELQFETKCSSPVDIGAFIGDIVEQFMQEYADILDEMTQSERESLGQILESMMKTYYLGLSVGRATSKAAYKNSLFN